MSEKKRILWLEDNFDAFIELVTLLSDQFEIVNAEDEVEFFQHDLDCFDGIILDDKIRKRPGVGEAILKELIGSIKDLKVIYFSAYDCENIDFYVSRHSINNVNILVEPKNFTTQFSIYIQYLSNLFIQFFGNMSIEISKDTTNIATSNTLPHYEEFRRLPYNDQDKIIRSLRSRHLDVIEDLLSDGAIWILIWGDDPEDRVVAKNREEILGEQQVYNYAMKKRKIPLIIRNDFSIDDNPCSVSSRDNWDHYPFVNFRLSSDVDISVHYDTGADHSLLNAEIIDEYNIRNNSLETSPQVMPFNRRFPSGNIDNATGIPFLIDLIIENPRKYTDRFGSTKSITLKGYSVPGWRNTDLHYSCNGGCHEAATIEGCKYRVYGLIGRMLNKNVKNDIDLVIRHNEQQVIFMDEDEL